MSKHEGLFPPLTYSRWTQWLLKDTSEDCIIHHHHHHLHNHSGSTSSTSTTSSSSSSGGSIHPHSNKSGNNASSAPHTCDHKRHNMELIQLLAIQSLEFTAPVYSFLDRDQQGKGGGVGVKTTSTSSSSKINSSSSPSSGSSGGDGTAKKANANTTVSAKPVGEQLSKKTSTELKLEREFIQLSGHPGSFAPAGPKSLWKKLPNDSHQEASIYIHLKSVTPQDSFTRLIPAFISHTSYNGVDFIELEDLVTRFNLKTLNIMDIKLGTRTFLETEVSNSKPRTDLFDKMYKLDKSSFTEEELQSRAVTKLRYMLFRERLSSTNSLGFRIEGVKLSKDVVDVNFQKLKDETTIASIIHKFADRYLPQFRQKLTYLRDCLEKSEFFRTHEIIGSSLLMLHDESECGLWLIDFAKTYECKTGLNHRKPWELGNREDGFLVGVDNLIRLM